MNRSIMMLNWLALMWLVWAFAPVVVLTVLALGGLMAICVLRAGAIWVNANDPWSVIDALILVGMVWAVRFVWLEGSP